MKLFVSEICKKKGITLKELAGELGITNVGLSQQLNGNPTIGTLQKIAFALGVELWELFTESVSKEELTALIQYRNQFYRASTIEDLESIIHQLKIRRDEQ